ncbi:hypothetical protein [Chachezhania sediminis]|uniref:hypothetical protein n=1 Tax=Chachezhania sediminis TaxID=2599291 RepID=UPI00131BA142|nr:hypothetical protein [Chachezhania sediminis]
MPRITMTGLALGLIAVLPQGAGAQAPDLSGGGAYETVEIAGFLVPVQDVETLLANGTLRFDPDRQRFSFGPSVTSERILRRALRGQSLSDPRAVRDLYRANKVPLPNGVAHVMTIPSGYGPAIFSNQDGGVTVGLGVGGVSRVPYTDDPDGGVGLGIGFGNAFETVGVSVGISLNDLSDPGNTDRISGSIEVSRYLWDGLSIAMGGENLFVQETDGDQSYYFVGSWAFDRGAMPFNGVATLGIGTGRFAEQTERDRAEGRNDDATMLFGALAWEVSDRFNVIADWNGRNLTMGVATVFPDTPVSFRLGVRDLTDYSGDGPRLTGSIAVTLARF